MPEKIRELTVNEGRFGIVQQGQANGRRSLPAIMDPLRIVVKEPLEVVGTLLCV